MRLVALADEPVPADPEGGVILDGRIDGAEVIVGGLKTEEQP